MLAVALLLCEDGGEGRSTPVLMAPYGALVLAWVTRQGLLAVSSSAGGRQGLPLLTRSNLKALHSMEPRLSAGQRRAVAEAVMSALLENGLGTVVEGGSSGDAAVLHAPRTVEELVAIPALASVLAVLVAAQVRDRKFPSVEELNGLLRMSPDAPARAEYMRLAGLRALLLLRHVEAHATFPSDPIVRSGFSCQVIVSMVNAALEAILAEEDSGFCLQSGVLARDLSREVD